MKGRMGSCISAEVSQVEVRSKFANLGLLGVMKYVKRFIICFYPINVTASRNSCD